MVLWMNLNKKSVFIMLSAIIAVCILNNYVFAERISDYEFSSGQSKLYVANRAAEKCIALTFDDGPHPKYTVQILDILKKYNAKATFFVIGQNAEKYPEIVMREYSDGHEIGNHTYSHPDLKKISAENFLQEIEKTNRVIKDITGTEPRLFRPPGGYLSNAIVNEITEQNSTAVLWSWRQDTRDWECPSVGCIVSTVLGNLCDGDIVLFHDYNSQNSPTPDALEEILCKLSKQGYKFVTVTELMSM